MLKPAARDAAATAADCAATAAAAEVELRWLAHGQTCRTLSHSVAAAVCLASLRARSSQLHTVTS